MKEAIILDEYDSQIVLLSKSWFKEEIKALKSNEVKVLQALWSWRCGVSLETVNKRYILCHLIELLEKLNLLNSRQVLEILEINIDYPRGVWKLGVPENCTPVEYNIHACLGILSQLKVNDAIHVDDQLISIDLVKLTDLDSRFLEILRKGDEVETNIF